MNKKIVAAGAIGLFFEFLNALAYVFVRFSGMRVNWNLVAIGLVGVVPLILIACSGKQKVWLFWVCAGLDLFRVIASFMFVPILAHLLGHEASQIAPVAIAALGGLIGGGCILAVARANDGVFRRGLILLSVADFTHAVGSGLFVGVFAMLRDGNTQSALFSVLSTCSTVLSIVLIGLTVAGYCFVLRSGREGARSESAKVPSAQNQIPLLVRIIPIVAPIVLLASRGLNVLGLVMIAPIGLFPFIAGRNPDLPLVCGWLVYITIFVFFLRCKTWRAYWTTLGIFIAVILVNIGGCMSM